MSYGGVLQFRSRGDDILALQLAFDVNHASASSTKDLWFRTSNNLGFQSDWKTIYHTGNLTNTLSSGYLPYWNGTNGRLDNSGIYTNASSGNIGIGTTTPEFSDWSSSTRGLVIDATSIGYSILKLVGTGTAKLILTAGSSVNYLWCYGANPFHIGVNGTERISILSNGNVGIGYTDRSEKLAVNGSGYFANTLQALNFRVGGNYIKTTSVDCLELQSSSNELNIGGYTNMYVNYRAATGGTPTDWYWMNGAGGYANFNVGNITSNGQTVYHTGNIPT